MFSPSKLLGALCAILAVTAAATSEKDERQLLGKGEGSKPGGLLGGGTGNGKLPAATKAPHKYYHDKFLPYAKYVKHMYRYISGCNGPAPYGSYVIDYFNVKNTSTQALLYQNDIAKLYILAFPGTSNEKDVLTDKKRFIKKPIDIEGCTTDECKGCRVHKGFQAAWQSIQYEVITSLLNHYGQTDDYKLIITGHSLGASLASLATAGLKGLKFPVKFTVTFGQPRTGNKNYAEYIDFLSGSTDLTHGDFYRVTHTNDNVPHHPARTFGYMHHSTEFWELDNNKGKQSAGDTYMCYGDEPKDCNDSTKAKSFIVPAHLVYSNQDLHVHQTC